MDQVIFKAQLYSKLIEMKELIDSLEANSPQGESGAVACSPAVEPQSLPRSPERQTVMSATVQETASVSLPYVDRLRTVAPFVQCSVRSSLTRWQPLPPLLEVVRYSCGIVAVGV